MPHYTIDLRLRQRYSRLAKRAILGSVFHDIQAEERFGLHAEIDLPAGTVDQYPNSRQRSIVLFDDLDRIPDRTAGCEDIIYNQNSLAGIDRKATLQLATVFTLFGEDSARAELLPNLISQEHAAGGRSQHEMDVVLFESACQLGAECLYIPRVLENLKLLEVHIAVHPGGQLEMTVQQRAGILEYLKNLLLCEH